MQDNGPTFHNVGGGQMKREAVNHTKMKRLCRRLDAPLYHAVGLVEILLKLTEREAPAGDVGKLPDEDIALALDFRGDERILIEALVLSGWLDRDPVHRLIVHDWSEHAEDAVHMRLARGRQFFANGQKPKTGRLPQQERIEAERFYADSCAQSDEPCAQCDHGVRTNGSSVAKPLPLPLPSPKPTPSPSPKPKPTAEVQVLSPLEAKIQETARSIHGRHPAIRRCGIAEVRKSLDTICNRAKAPERLTLLDTINTNHRAWCETEQWVKDGGEFSKGLENWLAPTKERYLTAPEHQQTGVMRRQMTKSEQSLVAASRIFDAMTGGK
jgi:hypothetical protein